MKIKFDLSFSGEKLFAVGLGLLYLTAIGYMLVLVGRDLQSTWGLTAMPFVFETSTLVVYAAIMLLGFATVLTVKDATGGGLLLVFLPGFVLMVATHGMLHIPGASRTQAAWVLQNPSLPAEVQASALAQLVAAKTEADCDLIADTMLQGYMKYGGQSIVYSRAAANAMPGCNSAVRLKYRFTTQGLLHGTPEVAPLAAAANSPEFQFWNRQ